MPKQFDIFVDEYQSAEGTNQEFDIYLSRQCGLPGNYNVYICDKQVGGDITVYSLPFRTSTRVDNRLIISIPDDAISNHVKQTAKIDSAITLDGDTNTHIKQITKAASDMVVNAVLTSRTEIKSGMVIDVNIGGTTLWRYRLLSDMDDSSLSAYDNMTLGDVDIIIL